MENMVDFKSLFNGIYKDKKVLVTGHTGFKGSWLCQWLELMGAHVYGYSLSSVSKPSHFDLLDLKMDGLLADLRDAETLSAYVQKVEPEVVFHLAAQALVRPSYLDPVETFSTNVMGTLHVFEACRKAPSVKAIVNVSSDKCYENREWIWGYRESDRMGGHDPYSASKGMSELLTSSYRNSFLHMRANGESQSILLASGRAGNVIGGGDWAIDRLVPDMMKAASTGASVLIRNPKATRPWQHVLEPLSGYLSLGWKLLEGDAEFAEGWNFGPEIESNLSVGEVVIRSSDVWDAVIPEFSGNRVDYHEANLLMLDCSKANKLLKWKPVWEIAVTIEKTISWYKKFYQEGTLNTMADIQSYVETAMKKDIEWAQ